MLSSQIHAFSQVKVWCYIQFVRPILLLTLWDGLADLCVSGDDACQLG